MERTNTSTFYLKNYYRIVKKKSESPPPTHWKPGLKPPNDSKNRFVLVRIFENHCLKEIDTLELWLLPLNENEGILCFAIRDRSAAATVNGNHRRSPERREITIERRDTRDNMIKVESRRSPDDSRSDHASRPHEVLQQSRIQYDLEKKEVPIKAQPVKSLGDSKPQRSRSFSSSSRSRSDDSRSSGSSSESDDDVAEERKKEKKVEVYIWNLHFGDFQFLFNFIVDDIFSVVMIDVSRSKLNVNFFYMMILNILWIIVF